MKFLSVAIHDVCPATMPAVMELVHLVASVDADIPLNLLIIPNYHERGDEPGARFCGWVDERIARGDEAILHGYTHLDTAPLHPGDWLRRRFYTAGEGEFAALSAEAAHERLIAGLQWFAARGWTTKGFVAPAWLLSAGSWQALRALGFGYTTTLNALHWLAQGTSLRAPCLVYTSRSAWRRRMSCAWADRLRGWAADMEVVRLGLHPADCAHEPLRRHIVQTLQQLASVRRAVTKTDLWRYYTNQKDAVAVATPTAMPASTSLG